MGDDNTLYIEEYPKEIFVVDDLGNRVASWPRYSYSSEAKTIQDVMNGVGMGKSHDEAIMGNENQMQFLNRWVLCWNACRGLSDEEVGRLCRAMQAAIAADRMDSDKPPSIAQKFYWYFRDADDVEPETANQGAQR